MFDNIRQFDLNDQWSIYLERIGMKEENMSKAQIIETKRAFYSGIGQLLAFIRDEISELNENETKKVLEDIMIQVSNFWLKETNQIN